MDIRSFSLNFEVNAVIYSSLTTEKLVRAFEKDISKSRLITRKEYEIRDKIRSLDIYTSSGHMNHPQIIIPNYDSPGDLM